MGHALLGQARRGRPLGAPMGPYGPGPYGPGPWSRALMALPEPLWIPCGPGPYGPDTYAAGPYGPPWALLGLGPYEASPYGPALMGRASRTLVDQALMGRVLMPHLGQLF